MKHIAKTVTALMLFLTTIAWGQTFSVSGSVTLEDQTGSGADHSGVKIKFINLPSLVAEDSTTSASTGAYSINIAAGYYLVEWTKTGYVPEELGGLVLTGNIALDDVALIPGSIQEVSGTVNTATWTTSNVFYVTGNCTIPSGNTLTINAGVRIKFSSGKGMEVNGTLIANGTSSSRIVFTSRESVPAAGDWDRIYLKGTNSQLSYFDYLYAANSLRVDGNNAATNTTIDNGYLANLGSDAYGIYLYEGGGESVTNNNITVSIGNDRWGIYNNSSESTSITNNTITAENGIYIHDVDGGENVTGNTIVAKITGIQADYAEGITIKNNTITGTIKHYGIYAYQADSANISFNRIERTELYNSCCPDWYGIQANYADGSTIKGNTIINDPETASSDNDMGHLYGILSYRSEVDSNFITLDGKRRQHGLYLIYDHSSDITRNTLTYYSYDYNSHTRYVVQLNDATGATSIFSNNTISVYNNEGKDAPPHHVLSIDNNKKVENNTIAVGNNAIRDDVIRFNGSNIEFSGNTVTYQGSTFGWDYETIYCGSGDNVKIYNNTFVVTGHEYSFMNASGTDLAFYGNVVKTESGRGLVLYNDASGSIYNNTIISTSGDYGLHLTGSEVSIKNNNVVGFTASIVNDNSATNFNINNNNTWDTSTPYSGTGLPPAIGSMIGENDNGTTADIYNNINQDPLFVHADTGNYNLQASSALINAGDAGDTDADGSVADIGALYYHIYVAMTHTPLTSTNQITGNYEANAAVTSTTGAAVTAALSYTVNGGAVNEVAMSGPVSDVFTGNIPAQALNSRVQYYMAGTDGTHTATLPRNLDDGGYEFYVNLFSSFNTIGVASEADGDIALTWSTPTPISGALTGYKVYKDDEADVSLTSAYLVAGDLDADDTGYTDSNVLEGRTYYYKVVGVLSDGSESLIGPEASGLSNSSTIMRLRGVVQLSDASSDAPDHSGVKVLMSAASPSAESDSVTTDITGEIDIVMNNGLYNIYYSKAGYQTQILGDVFLAANVALDTITLAAGGMTTVSGNVSGTLAGDTLYYVSGDLTVPSGETLTIEAGAKLVFTGDYSLTATGKLLVNGTADNRVKFTSGSLVKTAGDWTGIAINKTGSRISYADVLYSSSAIWTLGNSMDSLTINNCTIGNLPSGADGIRYYYGVKHLIVRSNTISVSGINSYGIRKTSSNGVDNSCSGSSSYSTEIVGNTISAYNGIYICGSYNARVDSNTIQIENQGNRGIDNSNTSNNNSYKYNVISPQDEFGWYQTGMDIRYNGNSVIKGNTVINAQDSGIYLYRATGDTISQNIVTRNWSCGDEDNFYAIRLNSQSIGNYLSKNTINIHNGEPGSYNGGYNYRRTYRFDGFLCSSDNQDNTFVRNNVTVGLAYDDNEQRYNRGFANLGNNASLEGNNVKVYNYSNNWSETNDQDRGQNQSVAYGHGHITSTNDTLFMSDNTMGIYANSLNISGTVISNASPTQEQYYKALYTYGDLNMDGVTITAQYPVYFAGGAVTIKNTTIVSVGDVGVTATDASTALNIERLTLIGTGSGIGINMPTNGTTLNMNSSVVDGFATGLSAASTPTLYSNSFYNSSTNLSGNGIGSDLGNVNTYNVNGDASDLYGNIFLDPLFVDRSGGDYRPTAESPLVNAGAAAGLDLDGTVADIGREFYNFGYAPMNLTVTSIQSGSVSISWEIVATDSLTGYQPYYKEADSEIWLYDPTAATSETNAAFSGLTNNALYDFAVTAEYNSGSTISSRSPVLQERPGVTSMTISPKHLIISQDAGGSATGEYTVSNPGSRNVSVAIDRIEDLGSVTFTKENYADNNDPDNWDYIWSNIAITRGNSQPVYNPLTDNGYDGDSPDGIKWAWGSTEFVMGNNGLGLNNEGYTDCQSCFQRDGPYNQSNQTYYWLSDDNPLNMSSMYLFEENLYFDVEWHSWQRSGGGGGFSYTRTHVPEYGIIPQSGTSITIAPGESETLSKEFSGEEAGLHVSSINFLSDDSDNPRDSIYTLNIVGPQATMPSVHFSPVDATSNIFYYVVQEASIDDLALETGDEIALFSGELCVGAGVYNGELPFLVRAYGAVPPDVPGFADGDPITVKAWDYGESRTATMAAVRNGGSGTFSAGGFSAVNLTGTIYYTQDIQLTSGSFNLVSSYLYPQFPAAGTYFGGITGLGIVYEDNGAAYIPEYGINTIGNVNMVEGYHLYMDGGDQTLTVSGLVIDPANWTITLQPNQFNSIAYLHPAAMDVEDALAAIAGVISGEGGIVQDDAGNAWIPSLGVPMGNMAPGKGYQVFTTVDTAVAFTYATYSAPAARDVPEEERPEPAYFAYRRTGAPYTIVVQSAMIDGYPLEAGDEVAVFDGATCVGAVVWSEDRPNVLSAWRGNEEFDLPGYLPGNAMNFQVYKKRLKKSAVVEPEYMHTAEAFFDGSSYSRTALKGSPGLIPQQFALQQNYPNPFNPTTKLRFDVAENSQVTMVVYNLMGQEVVRLLENDFYEPGRYTMTWQALNKRGEQVSAGMYLVRMTTSGGFTATRKMVLLK